MIIFPQREKIASKQKYSQVILDTLDAFYTLASAAHWQNAHSVKQTFPTASILKSGRVIFDINDAYHLVVKINYDLQAIQVQFFEPHGKLSEILADNSYLQKAQLLENHLMTNITQQALKSMAEYEVVLIRIDELFDATEQTPEHKELEILLLMVDGYQKETNLLPQVEPAEVIKFIMHQRGLSQQDIAPYLGGEPISSEVMSGKRALTPQMIIKLSAKLYIPVGALI